jgi:hypothetical protein
MSTSGAQPAVRGTPGGLVVVKDMGRRSVPAGLRAEERHERRREELGVEHVGDVLLAVEDDGAGVRQRGRHRVDLCLARVRAVLAGDEQHGCGDGA